MAGMAPDMEGAVATRLVHMDTPTIDPPILTDHTIGHASCTAAIIVRDCGAGVAGVGGVGVGAVGSDRHK